MLHERFPGWWALALMTALATGRTDAATQAPAAPASAASAPDQCGTAVDLTNVSVLSVQPIRAASAASTPAPDVPQVHLRDEISVTVDHLATLLQREQCSRQHKKIVLYLDGRPLTDRAPYPPTNPASQALSFQLERKETSRDVWTHLLGRPTFKPQQVEVSVGLEDEYAVSSQRTVDLVAIPTGPFAAWCALFVALVASFWALAVKSNLLRDGGAPPANGRRCYSLARVQIAFWFFIILASYLFIGLVTGDYSTSITGTVLILMGISAGTAIGSSVIDTVTTPGAAPAPVPARPTSGKWWLDILSDDTGVNFHRFQMAVWTLVLGIVFIQQVYVSLAMPQFDATLLGLMGISSGTYLGMKSTTE